MFPIRRSPADRDAQDRRRPGYLGRLPPHRSPIAYIEGLPPVDLGATRDGRFAQRLRQWESGHSIGSKLAGTPRPILSSRAIWKWLALARRAGRSSTHGPISMNASTSTAGAPRRYPRQALPPQSAIWPRREAAVTSSPPFHALFQPFRQVAAPVELVEKNISEAAAILPPNVGSGRACRPAMADRLVRALRLPPSLDLLAIHAPHGWTFRVVLRGRPALSEFPDFHLLRWAIPCDGP